MKMTIYKTKDYDRFSIGNNRRTTRAHIRNLIVSMEEHGFDPTHPLRVCAQSNGELKLLDGQHRLAAAKDLGLDVYYIKVPDEDGKDVYFSNAFSKQWALHDFCEYWAKQGKRSYQHILDFMAVHDVSINTAVELLTDSKRSDRISFKTGQTEVTDDDVGRANDLIKQINEIRFANAGIAKVSKDHSLIRACDIMVSSSWYNHDRMLKAIERVGAVFHRTRTIHSYMDQLLEVYNHKAQKRIIYDGGSKFSVARKAKSIGDDES